VVTNYEIAAHNRRHVAAKTYTPCFLPDRTSDTGDFLELYLRLLYCLPLMIAVARVLLEAEVVGGADRPSSVTWPKLQPVPRRGETHNILI
jgi:hypothetical protein